MVGWHHRFNGHDFEQTPGNAEGQGSLVHKESDMTEQVNNIKGQLQMQLDLGAPSLQESLHLNFCLCSLQS